ncbi:beta-lactamase family protein [Paenibacillus sp. CC-CFT747]|nr:beta-lactamase family protein [Paenibacillus sp. CC-CFT747]
MISEREDPFLPEGRPEDAGFQQEILKEMEGRLREWKMRDVLIVRGGRLVWEWHDKGQDRTGQVYSMTKSFLSALIGIAMERGEIQDLDRSLGEFYEWTREEADPRLASIRLKHLLTMTPGFEWPDFDKPYFQMRKEADWPRYVLKQPIGHEPGEAFTYNSGASQLLSDILTRSTGLGALAYARQHLFGPLGFRSPRWKSHDGVNEGGAGLQLYSRDLAKFGLLYLREGDWFGKQLIPQAWVRESTSIQHKGLVHYEPPIYGHYGYHWWVSPEEHNGQFDCYFALGFGGQYLFVVPSRDLVMVVRKALAGKHNAILSKALLFDYVSRAIEDRA